MYNRELLYKYLYQCSYQISELFPEDVLDCVIENGRALLKQPNSSVELLGVCTIVDNILKNGARGAIYNKNEKALFTWLHNEYELYGGFAKRYLLWSRFREAVYAFAYHPKAYGTQEEALITLFESLPDQSDSFVQLVLANKNLYFEEISKLNHITHS